MAAVDMIDKYLYDQPCTLWGRAFDINDDGSRHKAAAWFRDQIEGFYSFNSGIPIQVVDPDRDAEIVRLRTENERLRMELASRPVCP